MNLNEFSHEVHENAVAHGWWDEERKEPEIIALVHSEWSEALEEARAGRPMVWYACGESENHTIPCNPKDEYECRMYGHERACKYRQNKPEGIAVELIDGCIRILDYIGKIGIQFRVAIEDLYMSEKLLPETLPELVAHLHVHTAEVMRLRDDCPEYAKACALTIPLALAMSWVKKEGLDPLFIMLQKHEYNKTRPYKHGKKF